MTWRPKGWENPYAKAELISGSELIWQLPDGSFMENHAKRLAESIWETGTDAMLEKLRHNQWCPDDTTVMQANFKGKVVIIPDD